VTCICIDELRPASFRGVRFYVRSDKGDYGRRIVTHEYPMRDVPYNEDMGEKAQKFSITGYVFGDNWIGVKDAVVAACRTRGPAMLSLPAEAPKFVVCNTLSVSRSKDECGYFELHMEFTGAGDNSALFPVGIFEGLIGGLFGAAIQALTSVYNRSVVTEGVAQYVVDRQEARIAALATAIIRATEGASSSDIDASADVIQTAIGVYQNAALYAQPDALEALYLVSQPVAAEYIGKLVDGVDSFAVGSGPLTVSSGGAALVPVTAYALSGFGDSARIDDAIASLTAFATWSVHEVSVASLEDRARRVYATEASNPVSTSDAADAANGETLCGVVRSLALMKLAQALSVKQFRTRKEAVQARANVVELFNMQVALFDEDEVVTVLLTARDYAVRAITQRMATLVPVLGISAPKSMPSLYWANRLYDDAERAVELAERNDLATPAFMPTRFEALAR
jgi:hypothetical protein